MVLTLASRTCRAGARRVFTAQEGEVNGDQTNILRTYFRQPKMGGDGGGSLVHCMKHYCNSEEEEAGEGGG